MQSSTGSFQKGFLLGLPIMLGYIPVAFTFGSIAVNGGISPLATTIISLSNLTSSGQFAATNLIIAGAAIAEIIMVTLVINLRYLLMSTSLTQRLAPGIPMWKKMIMAFGVTDEIYAIASTKTDVLTFPFMTGLMLSPIFGWTFGTFIGAFTTGFLPDIVNKAMGIALYAMFISVIIPPARDFKPIAKIIVISVILSFILYYLPIFDFISSGWSIIIVAILGASYGAWRYPVYSKEDKKGVSEND